MVDLTRFNDGGNGIVFKKCHKCGHLILYHRKACKECGCVRIPKKRLTLAMLIKKAEKEGGA